MEHSYAGTKSVRRHSYTGRRSTNCVVSSSAATQHSCCATVPEWKMTVVAKILFNAISFFWGKKMTNYKALRRPKLSLGFLASVLQSISSKFLIRKKRELHNVRNEKSWPTAPRSAATSSSSPSRARPGNGICWLHCVRKQIGT